MLSDSWLEFSYVFKGDNKNAFCILVEMDMKSNDLAWCISESM